MTKNSRSGDPRKRAMDDQREAAQADTVRIMDALHDYAGGEKGMSGFGEVTLTWRDQFIANGDAGRLQVCAHSASPVPCIINAWELDKLRCVDCNQLATLSGEAIGNDDQCDGCYQLFPGEITPVIHKVGTFILVGGMCPSCLAFEHATGGAIS